MMNIGGHSIMRRKHRSAVQWKQIIENWQSSGLSVAQFCRENTIPTSAFYRWKQRLSKQEVHDQASFIQIAWPATKDARLELAFPAGHVLRFAETTSNKTLVSVLAALKEVGL
jgi:hypothetical protein